jgi:hypothetical protein
MAKRAMQRSLFLAAILIAIWIVKPVVAQQPVDPHAIDQQLFDDLKSPSPVRTPASSDRSKQKENAGEDLGKPSENRSPFAEIGSQMRQVELRLRQRDVSSATRQLQTDILARLTQLLEDEERQQMSANRTRAGNQKSDSTGQGNEKASAEDPGGSQRNGAKPRPNAITPDSNIQNQWTEKIWGVLPDRVQQRMQALGNEEFLPQFEQVIQQYYERLAERNARRSDAP